MAEQRLIDVSNYKEALKSLPDIAGKKAAIDLLRMMPTINTEDLPIVRQLRDELDSVKAERDSLLKEFAGECGLCANYEKCKKYPCYCIEGNMWEYRGSKETKTAPEEPNIGYQSWIMSRFERGE